MKLAGVLICFTVLIANSLSEGVPYPPTKPCTQLHTCRLMCKFGYVYERGCPICRCSAPPTCPKGMAPDEFLRSCDGSSPIHSILKPNDCEPGAICWTKGSTNGRGVCCVPDFQCPISDIITTCQITEQNCLEDSHCERGFKCCSHGCGKVCKNRAGKIGISSMLTSNQ